MNPAINFRPILESDIEIINRLMREGKGYWGYPEEALDRFMEEFGIHNESYFDSAFGFIAEENYQSIGYYLFKTSEAPPMLDHLFIDIQLIGKGYGRQIWLHLVDQARNRGWQEFVFWSDPNSLPFYERMGAIIIEHRPMVTIPGKMAPIMKYSLIKKENI